MKSYAVLAEGNGLVHGMNTFKVELSDAGSISYSPEMWAKVNEARAVMPYFASESELYAARKRGFKGGWNMSKAGVVSVGIEEHLEFPWPVDEGIVVQTLKIGYALWAVDDSGKNNPARVDYAAASISRAELEKSHAFDDAPAAMYALNEKGIYATLNEKWAYIKNNNNHPNVLGNLCLVVLDCKADKNPEDLEVLLVKRGSNAGFLGGTWTAPSGYAEPEYRTKLNAKFLENNALNEVLEEAGILPKEITGIYPAGFVQGNVETAMAYIAFTPLTREQVLERRLSSEIERRRPVVIKEYDSLIAEIKSNIEPESLGALEGLFGDGKLLEKYVLPFCRMNS